MPLDRIPTADYAFLGTVEGMKKDLKVWLFRVDRPQPHLVLAIEHTGALEMQADGIVTLPQLIEAGCGAHVAENVIKLFQSWNPSSSSLPMIEQSPIEGI